MKKQLRFAILFTLTIFLFSCKKDEQRCLKVKYLSSYCPKPGAAVVEVQSGSFESLVLLNVPEDYRVKDRIFYITYHYDPTLDHFDNVACPMDKAYPYEKMYMVNSVGEQNCNE